MTDRIFYHITGLLQSVIFLFSLAALLVQAGAIRTRKFEAQDNPLLGSTDVISLNLIFSSFSCFFSYLLYGASLASFNYYLVFTRIPACLITLYIIFEIAYDRKTTQAKFCFWVCSILFAAAAIKLISNQEFLQNYTHLLSTVVVGCGALMLQGQAHQIFSIVRAKSTGAISFKARFLNVIKDVSTVLFAISMGVRDGWPLIVVNGINAIMTIVVLRTFSRYGPRVAGGAKP